jgi:manganese/iron transport system ATP-binding protein
VPVISHFEPMTMVLNHVTVQYENMIALKNISVKIPHGALVAVVGPNGAGKSTLFKALVGRLPIQAGSIRIHGQPLDHHKGCIAYIPQREELDWHFPVTVKDVVMMSRYGKFSWFSAPKKEDQKIVQENMEKMGIAALKDYRLDELSGGQQQRVFLARALSQEPHILLMDEPFSGVDATTQDITLGIFELLHEKKVTTLVSTHDLNMATRKFELVLLLNKKVIAFGKPNQVFTHKAVQAAFGDHLIYLDGGILIEECCPPSEKEKIL